MSKGEQEQLGRILAGVSPLTDEEIAEIDDTEAALDLQLTRFFENGPFYKPYALPGTDPATSYRGGADDVDIRAGFRIEMPCASCNGASRTFALESKDKYGDPCRITLKEGEGPHLIQFCCTRCDKRVGFLVYVGRNSKTKGLQIEKGGVYPSVHPEPSPELARGLGAAKSLFVKGLISQQFGFGVGAFGYYRRVVEDIFGRLLDDLRQYADEVDMKELVVAIDDAKKQQHASDKIRIIHPLIPKMLRPNGEDPVGAIFGALSKGLHGDTDEECLDDAEKLRVALEFVVVKLDAVGPTPTKYAEALKNIQGRKAKKDSPNK